MTALTRVLTLAVAMLAAASLAQADPPSAEHFLTRGQTASGIPVFQDYCKAHPQDQRARYSLGALQFVGAVEQLGKDFYRYGLRNSERDFGDFIPLLRLPVPSNPEPETLTYVDSRKILQRFVDQLQVAEQTFAMVTDDVKLPPLSVTSIQFNFTGQDHEVVSLQSVLKRMQVLRDDREIVVVFDRADVSWIRGYCHLLSAMCEFVLAHDCKEIFDRTAQVFFAKSESPFPFLSKGRKILSLNDDSVDLADVIAFIHLIRLPVQEPQRMAAALKHLEDCLSLSGEMWNHCLAETDDDHEWIPSPKQTGALGVPVSEAMIKSWRMAATEGTKVLQGKQLLPFWRGTGKQGVNLRRVFTEPTTFDLVLWAQGSAAAPYLEEGELTDPQVWVRLSQVFRGNFVTFAIWFN